jgi:SHAQKYF class myb-like DNA-binding protein
MNDLEVAAKQEITNVFCFYKTDQGRWSREEHAAFMEGLRMHGREWKKIAAMIPSRTVVQIRTHAQKFFQKQAKSEGKVEEVTKGERKRLKVSAPRAVHRESPPTEGEGTNRVDAKDVSAAAGGITPRTVAAATILLAPRWQQKNAAPGTSEWMARQSASAAAILEHQRSGRRTSPRLAPYLPPTNWPSTYSGGSRHGSMDDKSTPSPSPPPEARQPEALKSAEASRSS